jgi:hypothetical protein
MPSQQADHLAALANHDPGIKGEPACQLGADVRPGDRPPDYKRARRPYVDGIEVRQLLGQRRRPEGPMTAHIDPSQKHHECHSHPPAGVARQTELRPVC